MIHLVCYCAAPKNVNGTCLRGKEENSAYKCFFLEGSCFLMFLIVINTWANTGVLSLLKPLQKNLKYLDVFKDLYFVV